jgi:hypothetical protein
MSFQDEIANYKAAFIGNMGVTCDSLLCNQCPQTNQIICVWVAWHMITACKDIYCTHTTEVKIYSVTKYILCTTEMLHYFFWVIPQHLHFMCLHFWILCLFHFHRWCKQLTPPKMEKSIKKCRHMKFRIIQYSEHDKEFEIKNTTEMFTLPSPLWEIII